MAVLPYGVLGGDGDGERRAGGRRATGAATPRASLAAAGLTVMPVCVPVIEPVAVSVAVIDWVPAVFSVTLKVCTPCVAGDEGVVGGQDRLAVAAGEVDGAGVAGGGVAEGVLGGDGDVERRCPRSTGRRDAETAKRLAAAGLTVMPGCGAGDRAGRRCRWR